MFVFSLFCFQWWFLKYWNLTFFQRSRKRMMALTLDETYVSNEIWTRVQITILHVFPCADKCQYLCTRMKMSTWILCVCECVWGRGIEWVWIMYGLMCCYVCLNVRICNLALILKRTLVTGILIYAQMNNK